MNSDSVDNDINLAQIEILLLDFIQVFPNLMEIYIKIKMGKVFEEKKNLDQLENLINLCKKARKLLEIINQQVNQEIQEDQENKLKLSEELEFKPFYDIESILRDKKYEDLFDLLENTMRFFPIAMDFKKRIESKSEIKGFQYEDLLKQMISICETSPVSHRRRLKSQKFATYNLFGQDQKGDRKVQIINADPSLGEKIISVENADIQEENGNLYIFIPRSVVYKRDNLRPFYELEGDYKYSVYVLKSRKDN